MSSNELFEFGELDNKSIEWRGMPEFKQEDKTAHRQIIVSFETDEGVEDFATRLGITVGPKTKSVWFPARVTNRVSNLFYYDENSGLHDDVDLYLTEDLDNEED